MLCSRYYPKGFFPNGNFPRVFSQMCNFPSGNFPKVRLGPLRRRRKNGGPALRLGWASGPSVETRTGGPSVAARTLKLPLGKLHIWENTLGKLPFGKNTLGQYLTSFLLVGDQVKLRNRLENDDIRYLPS